MIIAESVILIPSLLNRAAECILPKEKPHPMDAAVQVPAITVSALTDGFRLAHRLPHHGKRMKRQVSSSHSLCLNPPMDPPGIPASCACPTAIQVSDPIKYFQKVLSPRVHRIFSSHSDSGSSPISHHGSAQTARLPEKPVKNAHKAYV